MLEPVAKIITPKRSPLYLKGTIILGLVCGFVSGISHLHLGFSLLIVVLITGLGTICRVLFRLNRALKQDANAMERGEAASACARLNETNAARAIRSNETKAVWQYFAVLATAVVVTSLLPAKIVAPVLVWLFLAEIAYFVVAGCNLLLIRGRFYKAVATFRFKAA